MYKCWIEWLFWCEEEPRLRRGRWEGCLPKEMRTWVRVEQVRDFGDGDFLKNISEYKGMIVFSHCSNDKKG